MRNLILLIFLFVAISCSKESSLVTVSQSNDSKQSTTISISDALKNLDVVLNGLYGETKSSSLSICSVDAIGAPKLSKTKSALSSVIPDTLMYIANFTDNKGFAILAGDSRLSDTVYCVTESGSISPMDFEDAFGFLTTQNTKVSEDTVQEDFFTDMGKTFVPALLLSSMIADLEFGPIDNSLTKATSVTNHVALLETKWTQRAPFNTYIPGNFPAGCVAVACAQIMQYCRKPANPVFSSVPCSWNDMSTVCNYLDPSGYSATDSAKAQTGLFLLHIGQESLCDITYSATGSGGYADGVVRTLKYYGYSNVKKFLGFGSTNQSKASNMLTHNRPVYLDGSDSSHNNSGHAWVIDGEWSTYFHCNMGWNGDWDGYYSKNNYFPITTRTYQDSIDSGTENASLAGYAFNWNFRLVTYSY